MPEIFDGFVSWLAGPSGTVIIAAVIGFAGIIWQIGRQARHAVEQNRQNEATKLKLQIYQEILRSIDQASHPMAKLHVELLDLIAHLRALHDVRPARVLNPPSQRFSEFSATTASASKAWGRLMQIVEQWVVIDPRLDIFREAFAASGHECSKASHSDLIPLLVRILPQDNPATGQPYPWQPPSEQDLNALQPKVERVCELLTDRSAYLQDLQTEAQNLLVGDLFGNKAPPRKPPDPRRLVISLARHEEIRHFLNNETLWGAHKAKYENRAEGKAEDHQERDS